MKLRDKAIFLNESEGRKIEELLSRAIFLDPEDAHLACELADRVVEEHTRITPVQVLGQILGYAQRPTAVRLTSVIRTLGRR